MPSLLYGTNDEPTKMTYSRFDFASCDPNFTLLKQNATSHAKRTTCRNAPDMRFAVVVMHHAASCEMAVVQYTLRMLHRSAEHVDSDVAPDAALATTHAIDLPRIHERALWQEEQAHDHQCCKLPVGHRAEHVEDAVCLH